MVYTVYGQLLDTTDVSTNVAMNIAENNKETTQQLQDQADNSTTPNPSLTNTMEMYITYRIAMIINSHYYKVMIPVGLVGNFISFVIMILPRNRSNSCCCCMAVLALSDSIVLCHVLYAWLNNTYIAPVSITMCKYIVFANQVMTLNGVLLIISMTFDRYISICFPLKAPIYCTKKRSLQTSMVIIILSLVLNVPQLFLTHKHTNERCVSYAVKGLLITTIYSWFTTICHSFIPFKVLMILNINIIWAVKNTRRRVHDVSAKRRTQEHQLAVMLLTVSFTFLLLTLPIYIRHVIFQFVQQSNNRKR